MNSCSNSIKISGPNNEIQLLLNDWKDHLLEIISPHEEDELDDFLDVENSEGTTTLHIRNLDTHQPPIEIIKMLGNSLLESKLRLEYLNSDSWFVGILEIDQCLIKQEEKYHYKCAQDLQEFADRTGHLEADVLAFGMKDMFCYMENEEMHKYQTRSNDGSLNYFPSLKEAFQAAENDCNIWKISWDDGQDRVRMVRDGNLWKYQPII